MAKAPHFSLKDQNGNTVALDHFKGKKLVLYFYPKADTPGCTVQACGIRDNLGELKAVGVTVIGVSPDDVKDIKKFEQKHSLPFTLLADPETTAAKAYGVWQEKQFMGRRYMGVVRTTFLIDNGEIVKVWEKVNPEQHVDLILAEVHGTKTAPSGKVVVRDLHEQNAQRAAKAKKASKKPAAKTAKKVAPKKPGKKVVKAKPSKKPAKRVAKPAKKQAAKKKK